MLDCGQTTASRATVLAGNSIAEAGKALKAELDRGKTLADLVGQTFHGEWICDYTSKLGKDLDKPGGPKTHLTYGFATQVAILDDDGRLVKMIAAHDVGRVINPDAARRPDVRLAPHGHRLRADRGFRGRRTA